MWNPPKPPGRFRHSISPCLSFRRCSPRRAEDAQITAKVVKVGTIERNGGPLAVAEFVIPKRADDISNSQQVSSSLIQYFFIFRTNPSGTLSFHHDR
jgi:hypothetical protein